MKKFLGTTSSKFCHGLMTLVIKVPIGSNLLSDVIIECHLGPRQVLHKLLYLVVQATRTKAGPS